jgi:hypothetical protein
MSKDVLAKAYFVRIIMAFFMFLNGINNMSLSNYFIVLFTSEIYVGRM